MGVDLCLVPVDFEHDNGELICTKGFELDLNEVIAPFLEMEWHRYPGAKVYWPFVPVPENILEQLPFDLPHIGGPYSHVMFGKALEAELHYIYAKDVKRAYPPEKLHSVDMNDVERAGISYINCLHDDVKVFIFTW
ncbi:hypothetical protein [Undibacterium pigrum]|uniref:Uncharacterized protein n=1 Tax=Undibacterium pigrum TaxID=401470 RepID=A0A318J4X0_9BURK|nr:hypothetical protein [Undibacterium pigrum]PXX42704.1 hypothetical protein DFR42_105367 [Undibacterium pigrum]